MTTPSVDLNIAMPYGVTVEGNGGRSPVIVGDHPKKNNDVSLNVTPGPVRIAASWSGPESMQVMVDNTATGESRVVATLPENGGGSTLCHGCSRSGQKTARLSGRRQRTRTLVERHRHHRGVPAQLRVARWGWPHDHPECGRLEDADRHQLHQLPNRSRCNQSDGWGQRVATPARGREHYPGDRLRQRENHHHRRVNRQLQLNRGEARGGVLPVRRVHGALRCGPQPERNALPVPGQYGHGGRFGVDYHVPVVAPQGVAA